MTTPLEGVERLFRLDPDAVRCPHPLFEQVREEQPVGFVPEIDCYLVTRYDASWP